MRNSHVLTGVARGIMRRAFNLTANAVTACDCTWYDSNKTLEESIPASFLFIDLCSTLWTLRWCLSEVESSCLF